MSNRAGSQKQTNSAPAVPPQTPATPRAGPKQKPGSRLWRFSRAGWVHLLALMVIVCLVAGLAYHRLAPSTWSVPLAYGGDSTFVLGCIKAASEFDFLPFLSRIVSRLGAPYAANWNDFPMFEVFPITLMGMVARWTNLIAAWNFGILLSHLTSALGFYLACRFLRLRREWSVAGALLWAFSYYHVTRSQGHLPVCFDYTVPLGIVCCWLLAAGKPMRVGSPVFWACAGIALLLGIGNPYNLGMWMQFLLLGLAWRLLVRRQVRELAAGGVCIGVAVLGFLAVNVNNILYGLVHGVNQQGVLRDYKQLELYALKPLELVLPPWQHRLAFLGDPARDYLTNAWVKGEMFSPYLGVVGVCALVWLAVEFALRAASVPRVPRRLPSHAPLCLWVLLFSAVGGANCLVGLVFGTVYFRGSNRYSIFILALALLFLVSRMSRLVRTWSRGGSYGLAAAVAALGLLDQLPPGLQEQSATSAQAVQNDQQFCRVLEERLPYEAMIFQLPLMNFVEANPVGECQPYNHLRLYLWSRHLHCSFGSVQGRPRDNWQQDVAEAPPEKGLQDLERYGFAALYFNRKAYDDRGEGLLRNLANCGRTQVIEDEAHEQVCVLLKPSPYPVWPHTDDEALIVYPRGWKPRLFAINNHGKDSGFWACRSRMPLYFISERPESCSYRINAYAVAGSPQKLELESQGKVVWSHSMVAADAVKIDARVVAQPGRNTLYLTSDSKPAPLPGQPQTIRATGGLVGLRLVKDPPTGP